MRLMVAGLLFCCSLLFCGGGNEKNTVGKT